jgi:hypothetical protein
MKEILVWGNPTKEFGRLNINPKCTWIGKNNVDGEMRVYEVSEEEFNILCYDDELWRFKHDSYVVSEYEKRKEEIDNYPNDTWTNSAWRSAESSNMTNEMSRFNINHHYILAWDGDSRLEALEEVNGNPNHPDYCYQDRKYDNLLEYFCDEIGVGQPRNVCALAVHLAEENNMTMGELFSKYQG